MHRLICILHNKINNMHLQSGGDFFSEDIKGLYKGWEERRPLPFPLKAKDGRYVRNKLTSDMSKTAV